MYNIPQAFCKLTSCGHMTRMFVLEKDTKQVWFSMGNESFFSW